MKPRPIIVAVGALVTVAAALVAADLGAQLALVPVDTLPPTITGAAAWTWKVLGALTIGTAILSLRSRGSRMRVVPVQYTLAAAETPMRRGAVPSMPEPYCSHPLLAAARFVGRVAERTELSDWVRRNKKQPVRTMIAPGGTGKSALAWVWFHQDVLGRDLPEVLDDASGADSGCRLTPKTRPEAALWWSFDRPGADFSVFLDEAIAYLTAGAIGTGSYLSSRSEKVDNLIALLRDGRHLLVLDGFERELRAFSSLGAPYQGDHYVEDEHRDHRYCADLHAATFLRRLVEEPMDSRVLILSRLLPAELGDPPAATVDHRELVGLEAADAVQMLRGAGIEGETEAIEKAAAAYVGHPLSLRLLAGLLKGRVAGLRKVPGKRNRAGIIQASLVALDDRTRTLLGHLAAFRGMFTADEAAMFNPFGGGDKISNALGELVRRGLLMHDTGTGLLDLHPVIRGAAWTSLPQRNAAHEHLARYFEQVKMPTQILRIEEIQPAVEHYHHLIGAERYDDAHKLLSGKLITILRDRFADQPMLMKLLRGLFRGIEPRLSDKQASAWALTSLARACSYSGETRRAMTLLERNLKPFRGRGSVESLVPLLSALAGVQTRLGHLQTAEENLRQLVELTGRIDRPIEQAVARNRLGLLLATRGEFNEAMAEFDAAFELVQELSDRQVQSVSFSYYTRRALLMRDPKAALEAAQKSRAFVEEIARRGEPNEDDYVRSGWLLGACHITLAEEQPGKENKHVVEAERYLADALSRCRRNDLVGFEPDLLLTWARCHRSSTRPDEARRYARLALIIADRCDYRLLQADIHAFLARLDLDAGDKTAARAAADTARERAMCDGQPYWYKPIIDDVAAILDELDGKPSKKSDEATERRSDEGADASEESAEQKAA